jgi:hypothetical protein
MKVYTLRRRRRVNLDEVLRKKIADALANSRVATRESLLSNYPMEFTVSSGWQGYANPRVTLAIDGLSESEVSHLLFYPIAEDGIVVIQAGRKGEPGATEFSRSESRNTGSVSMRVALNDFDLDWSEDRKLQLPVKEDLVDVNGVGVKVLIMRVKRPGSAKKQPRITKKPPAEVALQAPSQETE